jgi:hypothetical protein
MANGHWELFLISQLLEFDPELSEAVALFNSGWPCDEKALAFVEDFCGKNMAFCKL